MPFQNAGADDPQGSRASWIRLSLAAIALFLSFSSVLSARIVPMNDLYSRWYGTRELILHGRSPYSEGINQEIQSAFYGHVLAPGEQKDEQRFAYPAYVIFLIWPIAFASFTTVSTIGLLLLVAVGAGVIACSEDFVRWPVSRNDRIAGILIALSTAPILRALRLEQLSTLVVLLIVGALLALSKDYPALAGVLLAFSTIKPQMALLPVLWLLTWSVSQWRERKNLVTAFFVVMGALLLASELWVPGWILNFPRQLRAYSHYAGHESLLTLLAGTALGWLAAVVVLGFTLKIVWRYRRSAATSRAFQYSSSLVMAVAAITMPTMAAQHNLVLVIPASLIVLREFRSFGTAFRSLLICLLAWTPALGLLTLARDVERFRVIQMSAGLVMAIVVIITMLWISPKLAAESA